MRIGLLLLLLVASAVAGCAEKHEPIDPGQISKPDQLPPGGGLFSGQDGTLRMDM